MDRILAAKLPLEIGDRNIMKKTGFPQKLDCSITKNPSFYNLKF